MSSTAELLLHPVRLRIVQALTGTPRSAAELQEQLDDVPGSSIYRHLARLREAGFVEPDPDRAGLDPRETRYRLARVTRLRGDEVSGLGLAEHRRMFTTWAISLLQRFERYLQRAEAAGPIDLEADRVGYTEMIFYADDAELDALAIALNEVLAPLPCAPMAPGRRRRRLCTVTFPEE